MKLKKLIVSGFKSFADRTEFEFDAGVTCVVGPNGCGKSNVVDAFKWVLGSQSAKSLRGTEMMDVIFNGSATRKPCGMAEATLVFDNTHGVLQIDLKNDGQSIATDTVSITRRLYRSGQSEYLINKAPCRLRDIKEMFMDTGVGVDAYSLIEQGKVEVFLQASQDERRSIFDEAAGISKYKARKKEAMRKLERVEQNLLRLNDILQEVEKRLRSIKYQAGKARNYQTYCEQLKEMRSLHFLAQYHTLSAGRGNLSARLDVATDSLSAVTVRIDQLEAARSASEVEAVDLERAARDLQGRIASLGGQITTCQQRGDMLAARLKELDEQILSALGRSEELEAKIEAALRQRAEREVQLRQLQQSGTELEDRHKAARELCAAGELQRTHLQAQLEDAKTGTIDLFRRTAQLHNEINGLGIRRENLHGQQHRLTGRAAQIEDSLAAALTEKAQVEAKLQDVMDGLAESTRRLDETREAARRVHDGQQQLSRDLSDARERRSGIQSRVQALGEMQDRLEGVQAGVRHVVEARRAGKVTSIRGMIGEMIETDMAQAALVEAALAGADQQLLADSFEKLAAEAPVFREILGKNSSVEVLCLDRLEPLCSDLDAATCPYVLGRVIDHVRYEPNLAPLMWRLLGRTLVVETLDDARRAAEQLGAGCRFVTAGGEVLEPDGRVRFGAAGRAAGVITRRSELAELQAAQVRLDELIEQLEGRCVSARNEMQHLDELQQGLRTAIYEANTQRVQCQSRVSQLDEQVESLRREQPIIAGDIKCLAAEIEATVQAEHDARRKADELEDLNRRRQEETARLEKDIEDARLRQQEVTDQLTEMKVALAAIEEKKRSARDAMDAAARAAEAMQHDLDNDRKQIELNRQRKADAAEAIKQAAREVDALYAQQQTLGTEFDEVEQSRFGLSQKLDEIKTLLAERRKQHAAEAELVNQIKIELGEVDVRIENLISRAAEEMSMDLLVLSQKYRHDDQRDWQAVEAEIRELKAKIERLGNVNLDAIAEQDELEKRHEFLGGQIKDINDSHQQLQNLILRINRESREMFLKTFEEVRGHFHVLFRKLFGGGKADIQLINPEDVLESGIEITARPPGKETRTLTLLSGGEKTMTALSLMFSIFKCRPSPFCLLDEVDAALDEQNTERFARLVAEFIDTSQFLVISHAKRTMAMADVLYGVTMQEPGVSKRISVRFEDAEQHITQDAEPVGSGR
jgi:chromosome segregation protein